VLLKPPLNPPTLLPWRVPPRALGPGDVEPVAQARRRRRTATTSGPDGDALAPAPLTTEEQRRLADLTRQ
jgi:cytochrome c-type biogenesis protein CcmH/NrfF